MRVFVLEGDDNRLIEVVNLSQDLQAARQIISLARVFQTIELLGDGMKRAFSSDDEFRNFSLNDLSKLSESNVCTPLRITVNFNKSTTVKIKKRLQILGSESLLDIHLELYRNLHSYNDVLDPIL